MSGTGRRTGDRDGPADLGSLLMDAHAASYQLALELAAEKSRRRALCVQLMTAIGDGADAQTLIDLIGGGLTTDEWSDIAREVQP